jgi:hypothetical protein
LQRSNFFANNYTAADLDSIGTIGWSYVQKATAKKRNNLLEYNYLTNWASVKLELGDHKKSLKLFSKALTHVEDFKNPDLQAKILLDKGIYYQKVMPIIKNLEK